MDNLTGNIPHPLTENHLTQINAALDALKFAHGQIALAERAGIDMTQQKAAALDAEKKLLTIKQVYFPGR